MPQEWVCAKCLTQNHLNAPACFHCRAPKQVHDPIAAAKAAELAAASSGPETFRLPVIAQVSILVTIVLLAGVLVYRLAGN